MISLSIGSPKSNIKDGDMMGIDLYKMTTTDQINELIWGLPDTNGISDGYHTFGELYDHRITLFITLCRQLISPFNRYFPKVWRSKLHADGKGFPRWFILGINEKPGEQITYHIPMDRWDECLFATYLERAPEWDGHTPQDVIERLKRL